MMYVVSAYQHNNTGVAEPHFYIVERCSNNSVDLQHLIGWWKMSLPATEHFRNLNFAFLVAEFVLVVNLMF
jgi:hypothetical protein